MTAPSVQTRIRLAQSTPGSPRANHHARSPGVHETSGRRGVSHEPPLVVVALDRRRFITPSVHETGRYAVNVLSEDQQALSDCFAGAAVTPDRDAFCGAAWTAGPTGLPLLEGAIATLECTVTETFQAGDHELFVARVDSVGNAEPHPMPLLYYRRQYLRIQRAETAPLEG